MLLFRINFAFSLVWFERPTPLYLKPLLHLCWGWSSSSEEFPSLSDCEALTEKSVKYPLMDLSSSLLIEDELLIWNLSSDCVVGVTALSPSRLLVTKMVGVVTVTDAEDTSTVLVVLLSKTLEVEEAEEEFFNKWKRWRHYLFKIKFHTKLGCCTCKEKFYYRKLRSSPFIRRGLETNGK